MVWYCSVTLLLLSRAWNGKNVPYYSLSAGVICILLTCAFLLLANAVGGMGATAYTPPAWTKHSRIQSQALVAMRTPKQQGERRSSSGGKIFHTRRMKRSCYHASLFSLTLQVSFGSILKWFWQIKSCTQLFVFAHCEAAIYPEISLRVKTLANELRCSFWQSCGNGAIAMTSLPDWRDGELPQQDDCNYEPYVMQFSAFVLFALSEHSK